MNGTSANIAIMIFVMVGGWSIFYLATHRTKWTMRKVLQLPEVLYEPKHVTGTVLKCIDMGGNAAIATLETDNGIIDVTIMPEQLIPMNVVDALDPSNGVPKFRCIAIDKDLSRLSTTALIIMCGQLRTEKEQLLVENQIAKNKLQTYSHDIKAEVSYQMGIKRQAGEKNG